MKNLFKVALVATMFVLITASCGLSSSKSDIFGDIPEILEKYNAEKDVLKEKGEKVKTAEEKAKLIEESKKLDEKYAEKIEKAAVALNGKTLDVTGDDIEITAPITLTSDGLYSKSALIPQFKVTGEAKTTKEIAIEKPVYSSVCPVQLVGYNAEGAEVFNLTCGTIAVESDNGKATVAAGTPIEFSKISPKPSFNEGYKTAKTLKLVISPL